MSITPRGWLSPSVFPQKPGRYIGLFKPLPQNEFWVEDFMWLLPHPLNLEGFADKDSRYPIVTANDCFIFDVLFGWQPFPNVRT